MSEKNSNNLKHVLWLTFNNTPQHSLAIWFSCGGMFDHNFTTNLLLSLFWMNFKNCSIFGKVMGGGGNWLTQAPCASGHSPADRWTTCLRYDLRWAATAVTASRYDYYSSLTLPVWARQMSTWCNVDHLLLADWCHHYSTLIVCAGVFSWSPSSRLMDMHTVGHSAAFSM